MAEPEARAQAGALALRLEAGGERLSLPSIGPEVYAAFWLFTWTQ